ncbi:MAG: hypothetical protein HY553_22875 [Elusimicrobia bacterium]|nr:hypothetical protein [Elusimicrobiota bacterium]
MSRLLLAVSLLFAAAPARAGLLSGSGAFVLDPTGVQRATFSNNERIVLQQRVYNSVASGGRLNFRFYILSPTGAQVFQHTGNAVVGSVGNAASTVSGVPIAQFYTGPGFYTFRSEAELDGQVVSQQAQFSVSSPNLLLIYPPNGARDVADVPLTFRWNASGATRYRVSVGDNPSMYNSIFNQTTGGAENFLSYPQNPADERQRLAAGQVYYWIVEGLDPAGNVIARSETPYNFSVGATALAKDLAVTDLTIESPIAADGTMQLKVRVLNQGNTTEPSISLRVGVGGLPAQGTPLAVTLLNPGQAREWTVVGAIPSGQSQTLATACLEFFDDNVPNNCKTLSVTRPETPTGAPLTGSETLLSTTQMWDMIRELLRERGIDLTEWELSEPMDAAEMAALLDGLRQGAVQVSLTGAPTPPAGTPGAPVVGTVTEEKKTLPIFGQAPPTAAPEAKAKVSVEQMTNDLIGQLQSFGIDLAGWEFADEWDPVQLEELLTGLKEGKIKAYVTGGAPAGDSAPVTTVSVPSQAVAKSKALEESLFGGAERAQLQRLEGEPELGEWTGMAGPAGRNPYFMIIKDSDDWGKRWGRLRDGKAPRLDFKKSIVVGVVAGSEDRADRVEIDSVQLGSGGLVVRYKLVVQDRMVELMGAERAKLRTRVPYVLKQVAASPGLDVQFERLGEGGER